MKPTTQTLSNEMSKLAEDAGALMSATAEAAGDKAAEARVRLTAAIERGKELCERVRVQAVEGAKIANRAVHEHPYRAMAMSAGIGAVVGYLISRRCCRRQD